MPAPIDKTGWEFDETLSFFNVNEEAMDTIILKTKKTVRAPQRAENRFDPSAV